MRNDFAALILTHGRPDHVSTTIRTLDRYGFTSPWYLLVDSEDDTLDEYRERWGSDRVIVFDKDDADADMGDNGGSRGVVIYARNACDAIAQRLGLTYYIQLDDDYTQFRHRSPAGHELRSTQTRHLDDVIDAMIDFLDESDALTVAFSQGGDMIGGLYTGFFPRGLGRKAMNTFICRTGRPVNFVGRINEDVNTYVSRGHRGDLLFSTAAFSVEQGVTQSNAGGMTETYRTFGTYAKSFYSVMYCPSGVSVRMMGTVNKRIHHLVKWNNTVPKIVSSKWQKGAV